MKKLKKANKLNYEELNTFIVSDVIQPFYKTRLEKLKSASLITIVKRKNPYLFKAKNIETAGDLAKNILDAFLSSQEETIFGDLMEGLAVHICRKVFGGEKAEEGKFPSVDLIFNRDRKLFIVGIKSGSNWGNSDQVKTMIKNFGRAKRTIRSESVVKNIIAINGCMYGRDNHPHKVNKNPDFSYHKICGQPFWELISGDNQLYKKIIRSLDKEAKKRDEAFKKLYIQKINEMTKDIVDLFYTEDNLDWDKIIDYVSKK